MQKLKDTILSLGLDEYPGLNGSLKYLYALIASLPKEEAEKWLKDDYYLPDIIANRIRRGEWKREAVWHYRLPLEPIENSIAKFRDRRSGCRAEIRNELQRRFPTQAWNVQLDILRAFLDADTRIDTEFVVDVMNAGYWHHFINELPSVAKRKDLDEIKSLLFSKLVKYLKSNSLAKFALSHLPEDIILENLEIIEKTVGYTKICIRLNDCAGWQFYRSKLDDFRYLYVLAETKGEISDGELDSIVYPRIIETPFDNIGWEKSPTFHQDRIEISLTDISEISMAVRNIGKIGNWRFLEHFMEFDYKIQRQINEEYRHDLSHGFVIIDTYERDKHYHRRFIEMAKSSLLGYDITEDQQAIEKLKTNNPDVADFIETLDLRPLSPNPNQ